MTETAVDLDLLAQHLRARMEEDGLAIRAAAQQVGCSPATLARLLQGTEAPNVPDFVTLSRAASWVGKSLDELTRQSRRTKSTSTVADVELHLRAIPGLGKADADAIVALVKAAVSARKNKSKG